MQRTVRVRLEPSPEQVRVRTATCAQFTAVFNAVCAYGWREREQNGVRLHHALYRPLKSAYPALVSDHHIQARVKATEAVAAALAVVKKGKRASCPRSESCPPRFNVHTFTVDWERRTVRMSTTSGRQTVRFHVPAYAEKYVAPMQGIATADLVPRDGRWWLHIVLTVPAPEIAPCADVVGVDLGLARPAVTSTGKFLGKQRWRDQEARLFKLRRALQQKRSKSAKRHLKRLRGTQRRFRRDCDQVLSKQIVRAVEPGGTIVLENLKGIRSRVRPRHGAQSRRLHSWSFAQLKQFIAYKAEERGVTVAGVDPQHTSQQCPRCGHTARNNRRSRGWFQCRACAYQAHADLVGARNIAAKYRAGGSSAATGGASVNCPIAGGGDSCHRLLASRPASAGGR